MVYVQLVKDGFYGLGCILQGLGRGIRTVEFTV